MTNIIEVNKDISGFTKKLMDYLSQSAQLGISVGVSVYVFNIDGTPIEVVKYISTPLELPNRQQETEPMYSA